MSEPVPPRENIPLWVVGFTSFGGSMGEAFFGTEIIGLFNEATARAIEKEYNSRPQIEKEYFGERWASAFPLGTPVAATVRLIVDAKIRRHYEDFGDDEGLAQWQAEMDAKLDALGELPPGI